MLLFLVIGLLLVTEGKYGRVFWRTTKTRSGQRRDKQATQMGHTGQRAGWSGLHCRQVGTHLTV